MTDACSEARATTILLVDDHPVVRAGYRRFLESGPGFVVVAEAESGEEAVAAYDRLSPALVLMDLAMPGTGGLEAVRAIRARDRAARIVVISMHQGAVFALRALEAGAMGYVTKSAPPDDLLSVVAAVAGGRRAFSGDVAQEIALEATGQGGAAITALTPREFEVLRLLTSGAPQREIAEALGLSLKTVQNMLSQIRDKLDARSDIDLMRRALAAGLVTL